MRKSSKVNEQMVDKLAATVLKSFIDGGVIDPKGKSSGQLFAEVIEILSSPTYADWQMVIDHTDNILKHARTFRKLKQNEFACLFYALWVEHKLNDFIFSLAWKKKLPAKEIESILRETSYRAKSSWLLQIFGVQPLNISHTNTIIKLMDLRNSFVHYKWKVKNEQAEKEVEAVINGFERTVKYLRYFEAKHLAKVPERRIRKMLNGTPNNSFNRSAS